MRDSDMIPKSIRVDQLKALIHRLEPSQDVSRMFKKAPLVDLIRNIAAVPVLEYFSV